MKRRDLGHLRRNMAVYIEQYYNRVRLHSALRYRPPEESAGGGTRQSMRRRDLRYFKLTLQMPFGKMDASIFKKRKPQQGGGGQDMDFGG